MPDNELPETLQAAIGYMQALIDQIEAGEPLGPRQRDLVARAAVYAANDQFEAEKESASEAQ